MDDEVEIGGEAGEYLLNMLGCGEEVALDLQNIFGDGGEHPEIHSQAAATAGRW